MTPTGACKCCLLISLYGVSLTLSTVGFYAGLNLIAWFMIFAFVRETKQLTLEELDRKSNHPLAWFRILISDAEVFSVPTSKYLKHELTVWLPWFLRRYILRQRIPRPPMIIEKEERVGKVLDE